MFVATLLSNPAQHLLTPHDLQLMGAALAMQGVQVEKTTWLKEGEAVRLHVSAAVDWQEILRGMSVDVIVRPHNAPALKLLISDMDSTMITVECIDELADFVGKKREVAIITERAMNGELDFEAALTERVALLAGLPEATLEQCYRERVRLMPGAHKLLSAFKARGGASVLVSGGFTFFTARVAAELGFDAHHANMLEMHDGRLTGRVTHPILGKEAKLAQLMAYCEKLGISPAEVLAIGDGANDLPMLLAAGLGVAYHAKPVVRAQAGAQINHCDLSVLAHF